MGIERYGFTRRRLFRLATGAAAAVALDKAADHGIRLAPPSGAIYSVEINVNPNAENQKRVSNIPSGFFNLNDHSFAFRNTGGDIIIGHDSATFDQARKYKIAHRDGNSEKAIETAIKKGATLFDVDANDIGRDIRAEHGIIFDVRIRGLGLSFVIDPGEAEIKKGLPENVQAIIDHIGALSDPQNPYTVQIELKRGPFNNPRTIKKIIDAILKYKIPSRIFSQHPENVDNFFSVIKRYGSVAS